MSRGKGWSVYAKLDDDSLRDVHNALSSIASKLDSEKVQKQALKAAGKVILDGAKTRVSVKSGELKKALQVSALKKFSGSIGVDIVAKRGKNTPGGYYAHLVEYGHKVFKTTRFRRIRLSDASPRPFMEPAFREEKERAIEEYKTAMALEIEKIQKGVK